MFRLKLLALIVGLAALLGACGDTAGELGSQAVLARLNALQSLQVTTPGFTDRFISHQGNAATTAAVSGSSSAAAKQSATWRVVPGLADANCYSVEASDAPGSFLRHRGSRVYLESGTGATFNNDATWCPVDGLSGTGISLESKNFPGRYLRHYGAQMWMAQKGGPLASDSARSFEQDVSFNIFDPWSDTGGTTDGGTDGGATDGGTDGGTTDGGTDGGGTDGGTDEPWSLVWSDEFNGGAGEAVNGADWSFNIGNADNGGWGNQELQYYTDSTNNTRMDGAGNLEIVARREQGGPCWNGGNCQYTSGRILTAGKVNFRYGKVEARIKVSGSGAGTWPAFWALGEGNEGWPNIGEIDVMEFVGRDPNRIFGTLHGPGYSAGDSISQIVDLGRPVADEFHTYTIVKRPNEIIWYLDGEQYHRVTPADVPGTWVFERDFFIILNQAIGGLLPGPVAPNTAFPSTMKVDYVRIYEENGSGTTGGTDGGTDGGSDDGDDGGIDTDLPTSNQPDFGPNVTIYDDSTSDAVIQDKLDAVFDNMLLSPTAQMGDQRDTFLFKPGTYNVYANMGFYTTIAGLGKNPGDVNITRAINVDAGWNLGDEANATQNFWRSIENLSVTPENGTMLWAVSQAAPMRRIHVKGNLRMGPSNQDINTQQGYASGGYTADTRVDGGIGSGSQQQWYTRNSTFGSGWDGGVWNMVFSGVDGAPAQAFPDPPHTTLATTPITREKPYLYIEDNGNYSVFVPSLQRNSSGVTWPNTPGSSIPMDQFYVAKPSDSTATLNQALSDGLNLFFTPGIYELSETLQVTRPNTVIYGLGYPTLVPQNGVNGMEIADVGGVIVAGILFDAGAVNTPVMLSVGEDGSNADHSANPTVIQDVFVRIGGPRPGKSDISIIVNSNDVVLDHLWLWRGDHDDQGGATIGWDINTAKNGLIVNGDNVLATGLFVEHYQEYQVIWNGENGETIFFQNEMPYDPPSNAVWKSPTGEGWASYKVANNVQNHQLTGGGAYCVFFSDPNIVASRGFEVPTNPGIRLNTIMTVSLGDVGTISNVVNNTGGAVPNPAGSTVPRNVVSFP